MVVYGMCKRVVVFIWWMKLIFLFCFGDMVGWDWIWSFFFDWWIWIEGEVVMGMVFYCLFCYIVNFNLLWSIFVLFLFRYDLLNKINEFRFLLCFFEVRWVVNWNVLILLVVWFVINFNFEYMWVLCKKEMCY